jgi:predicted protein tyrosine phosphatase
MSGKINILFVCTVNRMRSATAERIYSNDERFEVNSAGTDRSATVQIDEYLLEWADYVIVMERTHRNKIRKMFPSVYPQKRIICLYIPDEFDFMEPALVDLLQRKFEQVYRTEIAPLY